MKSFFLFQENQDTIISKAKDDIQNIAKKLNIDDYVCKVYFKSLISPDEDFNDIWQGIKSVAPNQSQWGMKVPTPWIQMERILQEVARKEKKPIITYNEMLSMCPANLPQPSLFVRYMMESGLVLTIHEGDLKPNDEIVIDLQWVIDAFRQVIDLEDSNDARYGEVRQIRNGKLTNKAAAEVWEPLRFQQYRDILPKIMENLGLIAAPEGETRFHYIPSLLPSGMKHVNTTIADYTSTRATSRSYVLDFRKKEMQVPFPHFDKVMAKFISGQTAQSLEHVFRYGCIAMMEDYPLGYVVCYGCSVLKLTLISKTNADETKARKALEDGVAGSRLIDNILNISNGLTKQFNQNVETNPRRGLSCNPFPPIFGTPISYATVNDLKKQKDQTISCCKQFSCRQVDKADLVLWDPSIKTSIGRWKGKKFICLYLKILLSKIEKVPKYSRRKVE